MIAGSNKIGHAYSKIKRRKPNWFFATQSIKVLYKNSVFKSWWGDRGKIKKNYLLFYESGGGGCALHKKQKKNWGAEAFFTYFVSRVRVDIFLW